MSVVALFVLPVSADPPSFTPLDDLPGGGFMSFAGAVSADGMIVAGWSQSNCVGTACNSEAFIWQGGVLTGLGFPPGSVGLPFSGAQAISADGAIVAGSASSAAGTNEPFRWQNGSFTRLGRIPGYGTNAHFVSGMSDNGSRIVGWGYSSPGDGTQGWLWENGATHGLGPSGAPTVYSAAYGISGDGATIVGEVNGEATRWTGGAIIGLGYLPPPVPDPNIALASWATDASTDGSVIVGASLAFDYNELNRMEAFRWTGGSMVGIGDLPGGEFRSSASAVSADGSIIVGESVGFDGEVVFIWDALHGLRDLRAVLVNDFGLDLTGWTLRYAGDVSADGTVIVGTGIDPNGDYQAFRAVIPEPTTLLLLGSVVLLRRRGRAPSRLSRSSCGRPMRSGADALNPLFEFTERPSGPVAPAVSDPGS